MAFIDEMQLLEVAHQDIFGVPGKGFGTAKMSFQGVANDTEGVQWHFVIDRKRGFTRIGVNLEGKKYDGWAIARLIGRELSTPRLLDFKETLTRPGDIYVYMRRDAWQVASRPRIEEQIIGEICLKDLLPDKWTSLLLEADGCLERNSSRIGRALQTVTLAKAGAREMEVSPHLMLYSILWHSSPQNLDDALVVIREKMDLLQPLFGFVESRSSK